MEADAADNEVVIAAIEADRDITIAQIHADADVARMESITEGDVARAEAEAKSSEELWQMLNTLSGQVSELQTQLQTLTTPVIVEPELTPVSSEELEEIMTEGETLTDTNSIPASTAEEKTGMVVGENGVEEKVELEVPAVVVDGKPVRIPVIKLV